MTVRSMRRTALAALAAALLLLAVATATAPGSRAAESPTPVYLDRSYSFEERAADLVSRMTLPEKASQMISSQAPAIPRLNIPAYGWWNEALHGVSRLQLKPSGNATILSNTTSYPISLALGSTWDPDLMYREAAAISDEAREVVPSNSLDLDFYSPTVNLARDPRWGRNDEVFSEDPFLTASIAEQFVNGMEGKDRRGRLLAEGGGYYKTLTTIKHYAANNSEVNRRTGSSDMDLRTLREYYTAQFRKLIQDAQPGSIMSSYNRVNGVPAAASVNLMDTLARQTWGFGGYFTADCDAIFEIQAGHHWQPPGYPHPLNEFERHAWAMTAGEDLDCNAGYHDAFSYANTVPAAIAQGIKTETDTFNENDVDTALVRLFTARMKLGEFDDVDSQPWVTRARARVAKGSWTNDDANNAVTETPERLALARDVAAKSLVLLKNKDGALPLRVPRTGPFRVAVVGYLAHPSAMYLGGYASNQGPPGVAKQVDAYTGIRNAIQAINPDAVVDFYPGFTGTLTRAADLTTVDPAAVDAAAGYDGVIAYAGTDRSSADEDSDRTSLALPGAQSDLIGQLAAKNPHTVAVLETIGQVDVSAFADKVAAMLWSSYNGQRKGEGLADVLLGDQNPSGRLPFLWFESLSQLPPITDYAIRPAAGNPGRTYMYFDGPVTYPFGYGQSYTSFDFSRLRVSDRSLDANDTFRVRADVTNSGSVRGAQVVQLYVTTPDAPASLERPIKRLVGFRKVDLSPGQTKSVELKVRVPDLAFFDESAGRYAVDEGRYGIQVSTSSADRDVQLQDAIHVGGTLDARPKVVTVKPSLPSDEADDVATRVQFPAGATVIPKVTVSMTDETVYGYVTKGKSKPLPRGLALRYRSNRPSVVSVDRRGRIRTKHAGVATITTTATYKGATATGHFTVLVRG